MQTSAPASPATIADPLDLHRDSCTILGPTAFTALRLKPDPVGSLTGATATSCRWRAVDERFDLTLVANYGVGLELLDLMSEALQERVPMTVEGYPAARLDPAGGATCRIAVGVAETQAFSAEARSRSLDAPPLCDLALSLAEETVRALRGS